MMVNRSIEMELSKGNCNLAAKANSGLCVQCGKSIHTTYVVVKRVDSKVFQKCCMYKV